MLGLGEIYERIGQIDAARDIYQTIIEIREDDEFGKTATQRLKRLN